MRKEYDFSKARPNPYAKKLKKQITIRLDTVTIDYFKRLSSDFGVPYQVLINLFLRNCAAQKRKPHDWQRLPPLEGPPRTIAPFMTEIIAGLQREVQVLDRKFHGVLDKQKPSEAEYRNLRRMIFRNAHQKFADAFVTYRMFLDVVEEENDCYIDYLTTRAVFSTDPPNSNSVGYAELSDYFYVWLRRSQRPVFPDLFATVAVPKAEELVATPGRHGGVDGAER